MKPAQVQVVYFNPEKLKAKDLEPLTEMDIKNAFNAPGIIVFQDAAKLEEFLQKQLWVKKNLLMMSSGNFGGIDISRLAEKLVYH
jgi:UDP-N-acetylmuramate: L-alanyl-gamma-D-glutamyl-meso-diaminopimelate ligase